MNNLEIIINEAVELAEKWQKMANKLLNSEEKIFQSQLKRLLRNSMDKIILAKLIDQSFRTKNADRAADQIGNLLTEFGIPEFMLKIERLLLWLFLKIGRYLSVISIPLLIFFIRKGSKRVILQGEKKHLLSHLQKRKSDGVSVNINHLGEAVLGEKEASVRVETYIRDLEDPEIEYISIKISTIYSQISSISFEHTVSILEERLSRIYTTAKKNNFVRSDKSIVQKFVNLDMEEYRDLHITVAAFTRTLDKEKFRDYSAGIVLQSYLPDSYKVQAQVTEWAKKRVATGGSPIKIRIVKGANMEMERLEAALRNWPLAIYGNKLDVDANFKRMVEFGMRKGNIEAVSLGIASHNLFELAFAFKMAEHRKIKEKITFEMLEGMADHVRRAVQKSVNEVILYAPVALKEQFINAIAYLLRRLDENTGDENFLRYASDLKPGSRTWLFLKDQFLASCKHMDIVQRLPNKTQDRRNENHTRKKGTFYYNDFLNEPDTDWSLEANRKWAELIRQKWKKNIGDNPVKIPVVVGGKEIYGTRKKLECIDPSSVNKSTGQKVCIALCSVPDNENIETAVKIARDDPEKWRETDIKTRHEFLSKVAVELRKARGDLIGAAAANTGKIFLETDVEISEAIDFAEYYPFSIRNISDKKNLKCSGKGAGLVISPWNFPVGIPCGGITAALAAGNTVLFKPSSAAIVPAWELCQCFWRAGISKNILQFLPGTGSKAGKKLAGHPDIDFIIFTGGTDTGLDILQANHDVYFAGETGGKNATIVTSMADRDQAISNVIHSAFSNSGQKCSATSILILEKEIYKDINFQKHLADAANSYATGSAWTFNNKMGPLIKPPEGKLKECMTRLNILEKWLLKPCNINDNPYLWTPGIKWDVKPGSKTHMTEFFGPLLGVMCAKNLDHAIELANQTGYGLTSALESLDTREQERWKENIKAGNLYINRGSTGAVVLRQPFGGIGKSSMGAGIKAGGPNYAVQFMDVDDDGFPFDGTVKNDHPLLQLTRKWRQKTAAGFLNAFEEDINKIANAVKSYLLAKENEFSLEQDYFQIKGQDNITRYLPIGNLIVRIHKDDTLFEILARIAGAEISGCNYKLSVPANVDKNNIKFLLNEEGKKFLANGKILYQTDKDLMKIIPNIDGIRYAAPDRVPCEVFTAAASTGFYISRAKVVMEGRVELLQYFREQSICNNYHRYGNLGERALQ